MSQATALLILTTIEETVANLPGALLLARQNKLHLQFGVISDRPMDILKTLELLTAAQQDIHFAAEPDTTQDLGDATQWIEDRIGQHNPAMLLVPAESSLAGACDKVAGRHQLSLTTLKRDLPALQAIIEASSELTALLERQTPFISPTNKLIVAWARQGKFTQDQYDKTTKALMDLAKALDISIIFPVRMDLEQQQQIYQGIDWHENIHLLEPLEHLAFIHLLGRADLVITGSSKVAQEAKEMGRVSLFVTAQDDIQESLEHRAKMLLAG